MYKFVIISSSENVIVLENISEVTECCFAKAMVTFHCSLTQFLAFSDFPNYNNVSFIIVQLQKHTIHPELAVF